MTETPSGISNLREEQAVATALFREHIRDCEKYRESTERRLDDGRKKMNEIAEDVKKLLEASARASGKAEANAGVFAGIPNAFWQGIMVFVCSLAAAAIMHGVK